MLVETKGESVYVGSEACFLAVSSISNSTNWLFIEVIKCKGIKGNFCLPRCNCLAQSPDTSTAVRSREAVGE